MMGKKGVLFSVMTVFLLSPLILLTVSHTEAMRGYGEKMGKIVRSKAGFFFLKSIDEDLERGIGIVGKRSMTSAVNFVISEGEALNNSKGALRELFKNGTINGEEMELMNKTTIYDWKNDVKKLSSERGFVVNIIFKDIEIGMKDSYNVLFSVDYSLRLKDKNGVFSFTKNYSKDIGVPIIGLEDPLFSLNTGGKISLPIDKSPYSSFAHKTLTGSGSNGLSGGETIIVEDLSKVDEESGKVLVTKQVNDSGVNNFEGVVFEENTTEISIPYVKNDNVTNLISNNTRVAILGNSGEVWDISSLYETWKNQLYVSGNGPSFLDRLEGKMDNSYPDRGIETFVVKNNLREWGIDAKERSNVDHIYFGNESVDNFNVKGMPDSFMMDNETDAGKTHVQIYGLGELVY